MDLDLLLALIEDDDQDLLKIKVQSNSLLDSGQRLIDAFQEINEFIREMGREPEADGQNMQEFTLYSRLNHLRGGVDENKSLLIYDEFGLLKPKKTITSIEDIFDDDDLGILDDWADDIFNIKHIPKEPIKADYVAQRKPCQNFQQYEHLFKECQAALTFGKRNLLPFAKEQQIYQGDFFVLKGVLTYVAFVGEKENSKGRPNPRLLCVFENGTESDMLLRSLARALYRDGKRVSIPEERVLENFKGVTDEDQETGYIYVLRSRSQNHKILSEPNLYKIGFSRIPVEERIRYAVREPTYLMAPVSHIASYKCFNINPQKFELHLHKFFDRARLDLDIFDGEGRRYSPREWFVVPLKVINQAIELFLNQEILNYRYDHERQAIVRKK